MGSVGSSDVNMIIIDPIEFSGVFSRSGSVTGHPAQPSSDSNTRYKYMEFSANKYNKIYGSSTTVQPSSIDMVIGIYLGTTS